MAESDFKAITTQDVEAAHARHSVNKPISKKYLGSYLNCINRAALMSALCVLDVFINGQIFNSEF